MKKWHRLARAYRFVRSADRRGKVVDAGPNECPRIGLGHWLFGFLPGACCGVCVEERGRQLIHDAANAQDLADAGPPEFCQRGPCGCALCRNMCSQALVTARALPLRTAPAGVLYAGSLFECLSIAGVKTQLVATSYL